MMEYHRIGMDGTADVYELVISDFAEPLQPPPDVDLEYLDPASYFVTSGDAIQKTIQLLHDIYKHISKIKTLLHVSPTAELKTFEKKCWRAVGKVQLMQKALEKARGTAIFMETEWASSRNEITSSQAAKQSNQHILLVIPKNPRPRK